MKTINYLTAALATLAIYIGNPAHAQGTYEHKLTAALVLSEQIDNPDRESSKGVSFSSFIYKQRISNRNLLEIFVDEGVINEIKGWSILAISENGNIQGFVLSKKGRTPVDVSDYFQTDTEENVSYSFKGFQNYNTGIYSDTYTSQALGYMDFRTPDDSLELYLDAIVKKHGTFFEDTIDPFEEDRLISASIEKGIGELYDFDDFIGNVEGSYKVNKGILTNIVLLN